MSLRLRPCRPPATAASVVAETAGVEMYTTTPDDQAEKLVAELLLAHLERCGWEFGHRPPGR